jgi:hypothetical protein
MSCGICLEPFSADDTTTPHTTSCNHTFHQACLTQWLIGHVRCPMCRRNLGDPDDKEDDPVGENDEVGERRGESTFVVIDVPGDGTFRDPVDEDRMIDRGAELASAIKDQEIPRGWKYRQEEWTTRMRGVGKRQYLLRASVLMRRLGSPPHLVLVVPFTLRSRPEIDSTKHSMSAHIPNQRWRTNRKPSKRVCTR